MGRGGFNTPLLADKSTEQVQESVKFVLPCQTSKKANLGAQQHFHMKEETAFLGQGGPKGTSFYRHPQQAVL